MGEIIDYGLSVIRMPKQIDLYTFYQYSSKQMNISHPESRRITHYQFSSSYKIQMDDEPHPLNIPDFPFETETKCRLYDSLLILYSSVDDPTSFRFFLFIVLVLLLSHSVEVSCDS